MGGWKEVVVFGMGWRGTGQRLEWKGEQVKGGKGWEGHHQYPIHFPGLDLPSWLGTDPGSQNGVGGDGGGQRVWVKPGAWS